MYTILLVDDERLELDTLQNFVPWSEMGFEIAGTAKNGKEALAKIGDLLPDVVITDVKMPIMDGIEFAAIARGLLPHLKIVFLSGHDDFLFVKSALHVEAMGYLLKPLNMGELRDLMEKVKLKCADEQRVKLSSRALAIQYIKDLLSGKDGLARKSKAEEILSLNLEPLASKTGKFIFSLITIDEYAALSRYVPDGLSLIARIESEIGRLASGHGALIVSLSERQHLSISANEPTEDVLPWYRELGALSQWITLCSRPRPEKLERLFDLFQGLTELRDRHVFLYGAGHLIVADESAERNALQASSVAERGKILSVDALHANIRQRNPQAAAAWIRDYFSSLAVEEASACIEPVEQACLRLLDQIYEEHVTGHLGVKEKMEDKAVLIGKLSVIESVPYMEQTIRKTVLKLIECVAEQETDKHAVTVSQLKKLIAEQYAQPLTIEYLAERVFMSPNYLRTIFKEHTGSTVLEYLTQIRMERASDMLRSSVLKIHEISAKVGYENPSHFCAIFLKRTGVTPNQYRKQTLRL